MRNVFVGVLFAIGAFLYLYKGFSQAENVALNLAGLFVVLVALLPTTAPCPAEGSPDPQTPSAPSDDRPGCTTLVPFTAPRAHGAFAIAFFATIVYVCLFRAKDTLRLIRDPADALYYRRRYNMLGSAMILLPGLVVMILWARAYPTSFIQAFPQVVLIIEWLAVWVFGIYWIVKSYEIEKQLKGLESVLMVSPNKAELAAQIDPSIR